MENFTISVSPTYVTIPIFGGVKISETVLVSWVVMLLIIAFASVVRIFFIKKFQDKPKGLQNFLEWTVESINKFAHSYMGERGPLMAAYAFSLMFFLIVSGFSELFGFRAPATDLNFTLAISLISFFLIIGFGVHFKGLFGYVRSFGKPKGFVAPFRILSEIALPVSLACRMFGNMLSGLIIMNLIYSVLGYFAVGIPAILSVYFNLFHVLLQTYVFMTLTLSFINEAVE